MAKRTDNLGLWDLVKRTNPQFIKGFDNGSFQGTATDPVHVYQKATEAFGPCGIGWGWHEVKDEVYADPSEKATAVHYLTIKFWFVWNGQRGEFPAYGGTTLARDTSKGRRQVDEDAKKKSLTDAIGKALSFLGFTADVRLGLFENEKYVEGAREFHRARAHGEIDEYGNPVEPVTSADEDDLLDEATGAGGDGPAEMTDEEKREAVAAEKAEAEASDGGLY